MGGQATLEISSSPRLTPPTQRVARRPNSHRPGPPGRSPPQDRHSVLYDSRPRWLKSSLSYLELIYPRQPTRAGCAPGSCCIFPPGPGGLMHGVRESTPTSNRPRASRKAFHQNGFPGQHSTTVICARSAEDNGSREVTLDENYDRRYVVHGVLLGGHYRGLVRSNVATIGSRLHPSSGLHGHTQVDSCIGSLTSPLHL